MISGTQIAIPTLVRVKQGALDRVGLYARRAGFDQALLLYSSDLNSTLLERLERGLADEGIDIARRLPVQEASFEQARAFFADAPASTRAIVGVGGGRALDVAKYVAFLAHLPYLAVPTSLSNDGLCSPQSSLTLGGKRRSLPSAMPYGVVIDTAVCLEAPEYLWLSGVGDLMAKFTALQDWRLAFHAVGTPVNDFAALLSDATVLQFVAKPERTLEGARLLGTSLMLNGVAMEVCGSSRPASGSEHLISHALDALAARPAPHGLQVGLAAYIISRVQQLNTGQIVSVFDKTGFWQAAKAQAFSRDAWLEALSMAPSMKDAFYTVLSEPENLRQAAEIIRQDPRLQDCLAG